MSLIFLLVTWVGNYCKIFFSKKKILARFIFLSAQMQDLVLRGVYTQSYLLMEIEYLALPCEQSTLRSSSKKREEEGEPA